MSYKYFRVSKPEEWIAHVELNRPDSLNAFCHAMWAEIREVFDALSEDSSVRAIILSGAGEKAFSVGLDVKESGGEGTVFNPRAEDMADGARWAAKMRRFGYRAQDSLSSIERCEKPVICVMHGYAIGISIDISTCADIRICSSDAKFSVKEVDIGIAADAGTLTRLPKVVGHYGWVKEVSMTARFFGAEEALRVGFVNSVFPNKAGAIDEAFKIARLMSSKSPVAVQGTKDFLNWSRDHDIATGLKYSIVWNGSGLLTKDVKESITSVLAKKKPTFEKL